MSKKSAQSAPKPPKPVHPKAPISFRRNILPPLLGVLMFLGVLGLLNAQWIVAQYSFRFTPHIDEDRFAVQTPTVDPTAPAKIQIPKLNLVAPIVTDEKSYDTVKVQLALRRGTLQYGSSTDPGQAGNFVVIGHSSGALWAPGNYKFVFTHLEKLEGNERIFVDFKGKRYIYRVTSTKTVPPSDVSVLNQSKTPTLTLITCTPVGTSRNRFVVQARQVSPDPSTAAKVETTQLRPITISTIPN